MSNNKSAKENSSAKSAGATILKVLCWILGVFCILVGIVAMCTDGFWLGLLLALLGAYSIFYGIKYKGKPSKTAPETATPARSTSKVAKMRSYPSKVDGYALAYHYWFEFVPKDGIDVAKDVLGDSEKIVDVEPDGSVISLIYNGIVFGEIRDEYKAKMVKDFKARREPCHAVLLADGKSVNLRFYRDKLKALSNHECDIVKLRNYKTSERQDMIADLEPDDELFFEEDDDGSKLMVDYEGTEVGRLPAKIEERVLDEGDEIAGIFVDHIEESENDEGDTVYIPHVKVFWA